MNTCRECVYWKTPSGAAPNDETTHAQCRRYPPSNLRVDNRSPTVSYDSVFPILPAEGDCGEFKTAYPYTRPTNLEPKSVWRTGEGYRYWECLGCHCSHHKNETACSWCGKSERPADSGVPGFSGDGGSAINSATAVEADSPSIIYGEEIERLKREVAAGIECIEKLNIVRFNNLDTIGRLHREAREARDVIRDANRLIHNLTESRGAPWPGHSDYCKHAQEVLGYAPKGQL